MVSIQFPNYPFKIKQVAGKDFIFDSLRKQWLLLTPEEWVRQNFIQYLLQNLHYPKGLIAVEKGIMMGDVSKRFDLVMYNNQMKPWILIECKAMDVPLTENVIEQALRYNQTLGVEFVVITNGAFTRCFQLIPRVKELDELPVWKV
jgi:hypothetical protein